MDKRLKCVWCGKPLTGRQARFCSLPCKISQWRRDVKLRAVLFKGGACCRCGYNRNLSAMLFHHKGGKVFRLADGRTRSWSRIETELSKCTLVCLNCHAELHHADMALAAIAAHGPVC